MVIAEFAFIAAILCVITLAVMLTLTLIKFRKDLSAPKGSSSKGILYAFTKGMMPGAKESASEHMVSYIAGIVFHIGVFTAFLFSILVYLLINGYWEYLLMWFKFLPAIEIIIALGLISGVGLLIKRFTNKRLRAISIFDDYFSNILVNTFLLLSLVAAIYGTGPVFFMMYLFETLLFLYIPLGKLRHCAYFFATRIMFGHFYGYRGVLAKNKYE